MLSGGKGNDTFRAWAGADTFNGDAVTDTLSFADWIWAVTVDLSLTTAQAVSGGSLQLSSIENAIGSGGADILRGSNGANELSGGGGNDTFRAWAGADTFNGDAGIDTLSFVGWGPGVSIDLGPYRRPSGFWRFAEAEQHRERHRQQRQRHPQRQQWR